MSEPVRPPILASHELRPRAVRRLEERVWTGALRGYEELLDVLVDALDRAASGKGAERHANGLPFADQPIRAIPRLFGDTAGNGPAFQVVKKLLEAQRLPPERARVERLDCIVYIASLCLEAPER